MYRDKIRSQFMFQIVRERYLTPDHEFQLTWENTVEHSFSFFGSSKVKFGILAVPLM